MSTLSAWHETKRLLDSGEAEGQRAYLEAVLAGLQPKALLAYLDLSCRRFDSERYDAEDQADASDVREFLAGLDEIRQLSPADRTAQIKQEFFNPAIGQVSRLRGMNWTGDHTYGDALDDVVQVLLAVWEGKGFPKLERFRCPSEYGSKARQNERVRCELQLPHESRHQARNTAGGEDFTWTDEQSVNPPVPYDEPKVAEPSKRCRSIEPAGGVLQCEYETPHGGSHQNGYVTWNKSLREPTDAQLDKIADEVFGPETSRCKASMEYSSAGKSATLYCKLEAGHAGGHESPTGEAWTHVFREQAGNPDPINRPLVVDLDAEELSGRPVRSDDDGACGALNDVHPGSAGHGCVRAKRHDGLHRDGRGMRWEK